jgi:alcohol dehydrogenase class IV
MYPSMTKLLQFWGGKRGTDGLLHPWTDSQWDFLGDWITPHGSEANITSPENILFNTCYYRHVAALVANISRVLGMSDRAREYDALAQDLSAAIIKGLCNAYSMRKKVTIHSVLQPRRRHFRRCASGVRLGVSRPCVLRDSIVRQTHLVMPLAAGVVEGAAALPTVHALEHTVRAQGHIDTGLTGTYFMCVCFCVACRVHLDNSSNSGLSCSLTCR